MKEVNKNLILIVGILLFFVSYIYDVQINLFFKNINFPALDAVLSIVTNFGIVIFISLIIPSIIFYKKNRELVYLLWITFTISFVFAFAIKLIVLRQRPTEAFIYPFIKIINYSFPSMHSMVIFSLMPLLLKYMPKQISFWTTFAFLVALSRIYFRFHFLSDVVFGALFGYLIGNFLLKLEEKGKLWKK